jgi:hypothetical protein
MLLSRKEAAAELRISLQTFLRHVMPDLPVIRVGKLLMFRPADLARWVNRQARIEGEKRGRAA